MEIKYKESNSFRILMSCLFMTILLGMISVWRDSIPYSGRISMWLIKIIMMGVYYCIFVHAPKMMLALYKKKADRIRSFILHSFRSGDFEK